MNNNVQPTQTNSMTQSLLTVQQHTQAIQHLSLIHILQYSGFQSVAVNVVPGASLAVSIDFRGLDIKELW